MGYNDKALQSVENAWTNHHDWWIGALSGKEMHKEYLKYFKTRGKE